MLFGLEHNNFCLPALHNQNLYFYCTRRVPKVMPGYTGLIKGLGRLCNRTGLTLTPKYSSARAVGANRKQGSLHFFPYMIQCSANYRGVGREASDINCYTHNFNQSEWVPFTFSRTLVLCGDLLSRCLWPTDRVHRRHPNGRTRANLRCNFGDNLALPYVGGLAVRCLCVLRRLSTCLFACSLAWFRYIKALLYTSVQLTVTDFPVKFTWLL